MGDAKVDDDRLPVVLQQDIARLEIPVHHPDGVDRLQRAMQPTRQEQQIAGRQRPTSVDPVIEGVTGDIPRDDERPVPRQVAVDDRRDPRMPDPGQGRDLTLEPRACLRIVCDVRPQHLDGDGAPMRVESQMDNAHPPFADPLDQAVGAQSLRERLGLGRHGTTVGEGTPTVGMLGVSPHRDRVAPTSPPGVPATRSAYAARLLLDVLHELVTLGLQRVDAVLDDVADADDGHQGTLGDDRHVADPTIGHRVGQRLHRVVRGARGHVGGHDLAHRDDQDRGTPLVQMANDVTLADDPGNGRTVRADDERADSMLGEGFEQAGDGLIRPDRDDLGPFVTQHVGDLHTRTVDPRDDSGQR